jgi:hypothetical protein
MNLKRRLKALEKGCGIGKEKPPDLVIHFMSKWEYGEMTREEWEERNKITPEDQIEIDKEIARLRAENPNSLFPPLLVWPPTHTDHPNNWKEVDPDLTR